jgi:hypothetical protein
VDGATQADFIMKDTAPGVHLANGANSRVSREASRQSMSRYLALSEIVLGVHLLFILWVALGALVTWNRPFLRWVHIVSLVYSILIEVLPWPPCPLTILEQALEGRAGINPYRGPFVLLTGRDGISQHSAGPAGRLWGHCLVGSGQ